MPDRPDETDPNTLIAELPTWNNGEGVDALSWIQMMGSYDLAVGYSLVFWPRFVRFEGYVLREDAFEEANLRDWERKHPHDSNAPGADICVGPNS